MAAAEVARQVGAGAAGGRRVAPGGLGRARPGRCEPGGTAGSGAAPEGCGDGRAAACGERCSRCPLGVAVLAGSAVRGDLGLGGL